jgi:hypothetical protein
MPLQILSATRELLAEGVPLALGPLLILMAFGAYHGLNPGMGWLFALSLGLQRQSERAIWISLVPIAAGHAASLALVALLVVAGARFITTTSLQVGTALLLLGFGLYKVFNYYRHPRWVGMQVSLRDLAWWSFLMAMAHGAGLMIAPVVLAMTQPEQPASAAVEAAPSATPPAAVAHTGHQLAAGAGVEVALGVLVHTLAMLAVMAVVAWVVYKKFGLSILRRHWFNFDLVWAAALLVVGGIALLQALAVL